MSITMIKEKDLNSSQMTPTKVEFSNISYYGSYNYTYDYSNDFNTKHSFYDLAATIHINLSHYYVPTIVLFGCIGNILSVFVFFKTKLRKLSSSYYLAALAISDTIFLLVALVAWLNFVNINIYNREYFCEFFTYVSGLCSFLSVWFVVAFTVERFIAVQYPLKRQSMCTVKRACTVLGFLFILGCFINIPYFAYASLKYIKDIDDLICDVDEKYKHHMQIFNYVDTVIVFIIPFTIIVILNTITAMAVWKVAGVRRKMTMTAKESNSREFRKRFNTQKVYLDYSEVSSNSNSNHTLRVPKKNANSSQVKVTKMLLIVSSVFVLLNLPSYIMRIKAYLIAEESQNNAASILAQTISWFLFVTNFGINFLLYCLSGQNFRKAVMSMFSKFNKKERVRHHEAVTTQMTVSEYLRSSNNSTKRHGITSSNSLGITEIQESNFFHDASILHNNA